MGICVEKGSELLLGADGRKFKGRYVFQGKRVFDESSEAALANEVGSSGKKLGKQRTAKVDYCS